MNDLGRNEPLDLSDLRTQLTNLRSEALSLATDLLAVLAPLPALAVTEIEASAPSMRPEQVDLRRDEQQTAMILPLPAGSTRIEF